MAQELIIMTPKELSRYEVIKRLIQKEINGTEAAKQLNLTVRQVKNLKAKVKKYGAKGIIHGGRGQSGNRRISEKKIATIEKIIRMEYPDFGPSFASEKLKENYQIKINKETLRQLMTIWGLWTPKPRKTNKEYRAWRPRKEQYGEMIQFDGSYEEWFEERSPQCCLLAAIDDASGKITGARFDYDEGVIPVFNFWREYVKMNGKPLNIYLDKFSTYKNIQKGAEDKELLTQFQRAMTDLGVKLLTAHSPQAKGRIERLFGTLQDRLIKELRLANISTIEEANKFLKEKFVPKFNQKFAVLPQKKGDLHKSLTKVDKVNLDRIFSIQEMRVVNNDFTISYKGKWYQLLEQQPTLVLRKDRVLVEERTNGDIFLSLRNKYLNFKELPVRPPKVNMKVIALSRERPTWKPPPSHPWRHSLIFNR